MKLFGFEIKRTNSFETKRLQTYIPGDSDDGSLVVSSPGGYGTTFDVDGTVRSEEELINRYREMSLYPEVETAIDEIVNEAIVQDVANPIVLNFGDLQLNDDIRDTIQREFNYILKLLRYREQGYELFRRWYIDGRLYIFIVIDSANPAAGIQELRYVDSRKMRKIREEKPRLRFTDPEEVNEYFIYNDAGFGLNKYPQVASVVTNDGIRIAKDSVVYVTSGLMDASGKTVLSYLHKAIRILNQLRIMEDALIIYRLARAPERRIWYIDVGNLPKTKAEQYVREIMTKHRNRIVYDATTGEIRNDRNVLTLLDDYWLPRREGGRGTEVTTLPGGQSLGVIDDIQFFQRKLYRALNVPETRLNPEAMYSIGRTAEITRDELRFYNFIRRLRARFSILFRELLGRQLILKNIVSPVTWDALNTEISFEFATSNYFEEFRRGDVLSRRIEIVSNLQASGIDKVYFSKEWIRKNVLYLSDEEWERIQKEQQYEQEQSQTGRAESNRSSIDFDGEA